MDEERILEQLDLEKHEATLYLLLLRLGEASAVMLARESSLHRRTVYDTLERLQKKGLVHLKIKKFVKYFAPTDPDALREMLEEKQAMLRGILPKLLEQFRAKEKKVSVNIFEGIEGIKAVLADATKECLAKKDELVMVGAGLRTPEYLKYSFPRYVEVLKKKIKWRLIEPDLPRIRKGIALWGIPCNCRFLPEKYLAPVGILTYANRTIIMLLDGEPVLIQIIGASYAKAFKNYFELLWNATKP